MRPYFALIDEHHTPPLRYTLGRLLACAETADIAITQLRLAGLDLTESETGRLRRCRVIIGRVDAAALLDAPAVVPGEGVSRLASFAQSGRLEMRTAPHHTWHPDFSVFTGLPGNAAVVLIGAHYFGRPYPRFGAALTCVLTGSPSVQLCQARFENLWEAGYDVLPVVANTLEALAAPDSGR